MGERLQACDLLLRMIGEINMSRDQFRCVFVVSLYVTKVFSESVPLFYKRITFCKKYKLCSRWHWLRHRWNGKWSWWIVCFPIFSQRCEWKKHVLPRYRAHLKINGGYVNILPVLISFWFFLKRFRIIDFLLGWEGEMEFSHNFSYVTFVMLTADQFVRAWWWPT